MRAELSRSTVVLFVFLMVIGVGAIYIARTLQVKLATPAGLRVSSEQRLRNLHAALHAYHQAHGLWPDSRLSLLRDRRLGVAAAAGIAYRPPVITDDDVVIFWREQLLPGVRAGEPWAGRDQPAAADVPTVGHAITLGGTLLVLPAAAFTTATAQWASMDPADPQPQESAAIPAAGAEGVE